ncbi:hypothetical protein SAMN05216588_102417 [Pseudomonas flavescens]|uniref:Uncharacterized protein n=1 Tax=Phytopseudomonas flavescens TaxID=29435 RepID=A0A1G7ZNK6_9GAMM|nr:hypothetical protein [Pseudomonas flavescens]SDH10254.1 hypothetical protein SAMN05216588_102417 [Pseudomonas flavescens]
MNRVQLQGRAPTLREQQRAALSRFSTVPTANWDALRERFAPFVGPYAPPVIDHDAETRAYWRMAHQFERFGRLIPEESFTGVPFCGDRTFTQQENTL